MAQERQSPGSTVEGQVSQPPSADTERPAALTVASRLNQIIVITVFAVAALFLLILGYYGWARLTGNQALFHGDSPITQILVLLGALFGVVVGLIGAYYGVKSANDVQASAQAESLPDSRYASLKRVSDDLSEELSKAGVDQEAADVITYRVLKVMLETGAANAEAREAAEAVVQAAQQQRKEHEEPGNT